MTDVEMKARELLDCPLCRSDDVASTFVTGMVCQWEVRCRRCGLTIIRGCKPFDESSRIVARENAEAAWNTRHQPTPAGDVVESVVKHVARSVDVEALMEEARVRTANGGFFDTHFSRVVVDWAARSAISAYEARVGWQPMREALAEAVATLSQIPAPHSHPLWTRMLNAIRAGEAALTLMGRERSDPDLGKIERGHVCKHGIRWPHPCQPCDDEAWAKFQLGHGEAQP